MGISARDVVFYVLVTSVGRYAVRSGIAHVVQIIQQVFIAVHVRIGVRAYHFQLFGSVGCVGRTRRVLHCTVVELGVFVGIEEVRQLRGLLDIHLASVVDRYFLIAGCPFGLY